MKQSKEPKYSVGDDKCTTCYGLSILTRKVLLKNGIPLCIGYQEVKSKFLTKDLIDSFDEEASIPESNFSAQIAIGKSVVSGKMEREKKLPIVLIGMTLQMNYKEDIDDEDITSTGTEITPSLNKEPINMMDPKNALQFLKKLQSFSIPTSEKDFAKEMFQKYCTAVVYNFKYLARELPNSLQKNLALYPEVVIRSSAQLWKFYMDVTSKIVKHIRDKNSTS